MTITLDRDEAIVKEYLTYHIAPKKIAYHFDTTKENIIEVLQRYGVLFDTENPVIKIRRIPRRIPVIKELLPQEELLKRNIEIIEMYYAQCDGSLRYTDQRNTLEEIGDVFNISRERVRQIINKRGIKKRFKAYVIDRTPEPTFAEVFWGLVGPADKNGCRLWQGCMDPSGYGRMTRRLDEIGESRSHRIAWRLTYGEIPIDGDGKTLNINHRRNCISRACCEPTHLYAGTQQENVHDWLALKFNKPNFGCIDELDIEDEDS